MMSWIGTSREVLKQIAVQEPVLVERPRCLIIHELLIDCSDGAEIFRAEHCRQKSCQEYKDQDTPDNRGQPAARTDPASKE